MWIGGSLHANESVNAQALFAETYDLLRRNDRETLRILNDDILLRLGVCYAALFAAHRLRWASAIAFR